MNTCMHALLLHGIQLLIDTWLIKSYNNQEVHYNTYMDVLPVSMNYTCSHELQC